MSNPSMISKKEIAQRIGVDPRTIDRWVKAGRIPPPRLVIAGTTRWDASDLEQILRKDKSESH